MKHLSRCLCLATLLAPVWASAANAPAPAQKRFAVLEFGPSKDMPTDELLLVSDAARAGVLSVLPEDKFLLMTRESMAAITRDMGKKDCGEEECEVDILQTLGAHYGLTGSVTRVEGTYIVSMKLFETERSNFIGATKVTAKTKLELLERVEKESAVLVAKSFHLQPAAGQAAAGLSFSRGVNLATPVIEIRPGTASALRDINIEVEELLDQAQKVQGAAGSLPRAKADAWCRLAAVTQNNPYLSSAQSGCASWTRYAAQHEELVRNAEKDMNTLRRFAQLGSRSAEEKLAASRSYLEAYQQLGTDAPLVREAQALESTWSANAKREKALPQATSEYTDLCARMEDLPRDRKIALLKAFVEKHAGLADTPLLRGAAVALASLQEQERAERDSRSGPGQAAGPENTASTTTAKPASSGLPCLPGLGMMGGVALIGGLFALAAVVLGAGALLIFGAPNATSAADMFSTKNLGLTAGLSGGTLGAVLLVGLVVAVAIGAIALFYFFINKN